MKKMLAMLLALVMILGLAACASTKPAADATATSEPSNTGDSASAETSAEASDAAPAESGKTYTVEITNKMDLGINNVSAEILYGDLIIRISPQAAAKMEADFIHEMVHAIYFGLGYRDHDEKRVDELANALHSVIVDNPDVFAPAEVGRHES